MLSILSIKPGFGQSESVGFQNLLLYPDASYRGSGESNSATLSNSSALFLSSYFSPDDSSQDVIFNQSDYMGILSHSQLTTKLILFGRPFMAGFSHLSATDIELRDKPGDAQGTFNVYWLTFAIGTALDWDELRFGLTIKHSVNQLFLSEQYATLLDISISHPGMRLYGLPYIAIQNIGKSSKLYNQQASLPTLIKTGLILYDHHLTEDYRIMVTNDWVYIFNGSDIHSNIGGAFSYKNLLTVRTGFRLLHDSASLAAGFGLMVGDYSLNYSYNTHQYHLPSTHSFTFGIQF